MPSAMRRSKVENMPFIRRILRFLAHIDGREKGLKLVQYGSKTALFGLQNQTIQQGLLQSGIISMPRLFLMQFAFKALSGTVGQARLVFKLSNWMEGFTRLVDVAVGNAPVDVNDVWFYVELLSTIATTANGFCTDAVCLAKSFKSRAWTNYFLPLRLRFFMMAIVANMAMNLRRQADLQRELAASPAKKTLLSPVSRHKAPLGVPPSPLDGLKPQKTEAKATLGIQLGVLRMGMIKYLVDFAFCAYILRNGPQHATVALLGLASAVLGARKRWQRS